jgi:hypothetical protein
MEGKDEIRDYVFAFECSVGWENLERTEDETCRFCRRCARNVYFVETQTQLNETARKGNCVAFPNPEPSPFHPILGGHILPPFFECKGCKKTIARGEAAFGSDLCPECRTSNSASIKSWWQFWK